MLRREFLVDLTRLAALASTVPNDWRVLRTPHLADQPFSLGVASGDPTPNGAMLWTRIAPKPLEPLGGMDGIRATVAWEVANDESFRSIVKQGRATAVPELGYSVHADVTGLDPDRWYFYRFHVGQTASAVGRVRTTPAAQVRKPLNFAFASCQHYEQGYYTAHEHMAREELDLVAFLGDYIYEYGPNTQAVRTHNSTEIMNLDAYRARYAQYKSDPALQAAHARCPWLMITDDHEVDNNYADLISENDVEPVEWMRNRRAAAYQAWWEHQPVRTPRANSWADLVQMRRVEWGDMARIHLLDGRQHRSNQACGDGRQEVPCGEWGDAKRTMLGAEQEQWLTQGLAESTQHWQILANQVMLAPVDLSEGPKRTFDMDQWGGYPAASARLVAAIAKHAPNRTVTVSGDIHSNWVNELHDGFASDEKPIVGAEFVGTSISSGGDGADRMNGLTPSLLSENPHLKWQNSRRGYVVCHVGDDAWTTEYRTVGYVTKPGAPIETPTKWRVEHGRPGIIKL
ncbi:MAG TPA: alkaline phosphatase D family protein [Gemmatimonadaceae bacterium]|jgi:alkaline phosphatase D